MNLKPYQYIYVTYFPLVGTDLEEISNLLIAGAKEHDVNDPVIEGCPVSQWDGPVPENCNIKAVYWWTLEEH